MAKLFESYFRELGVELESSEFDELYSDSITDLSEELNISLDILEDMSCKRKKSKFKGKTMNTEQIIENVMKRYDTKSPDEIFVEQLETVSDAYADLLVPLYQSLDESNKHVFLNSMMDEDGLEDLIAHALEENRAGNLSPGTGSKAAMKLLVGKNYTNNRGANSPVTDHGRASTEDNLHGRLVNAMKQDGIATIHHNGKPIAHVRRVEDPYNRNKYKYHVVDHAEDSVGKTKHVEYRKNYRAHYNPTTSKVVKKPSYDRYEYENEDHDVHQMKSAVSNIVKKHTGGTIDRPTLKSHAITIHSYGVDTDRLKKREDRLKSRIVSDDNPIQKRAAEKFAAKKVGTGEDSPKAKAEEMHAKLGEAIKSGDHRAAREHIEALRTHIQQHSSYNMQNSSVLSDKTDDQKSIESNARDVLRRKEFKAGNWNFSRDRLLRKLNDIKAKRAVNEETDLLKKHRDLAQYHIDKAHEIHKAAGKHTAESKKHRAAYFKHESAANALKDDTAEQRRERSKISNRALSATDRLKEDLDEGLLDMFSSPKKKAEKAEANAKKEALMKRHDELCSKHAVLSYDNNLTAYQRSSHSDAAQQHAKAKAALRDNREGAENHSQRAMSTSRSMNVN